MSRKWYDYWLHSLKGISKKKKEELFKNKIKSEDIFNIEETSPDYQLHKWFTDEEMNSIPNVFVNYLICLVRYL